MKEEEKRRGGRLTERKGRLRRRWMEVREEGMRV